MFAKGAGRADNALVRIDLRDPQRQRLFRVEVDPKRPPAVVRREPTPAAATPSNHSAASDVYLDWEKAFDDQGFLRKCPVCSCRELFVRKDFPQVTGFLLVVLVAVIAVALFAADQVVLAVGVLIAVALLDCVIYFFTGKCLVCYRCRSEFRQLPIRHSHRGWELATGEKYRQLAAAPPSSPTSGPPAAADDPGEN